MGHRRQRASRRPAERKDDAARALWMFDHVAGRCIEKPPSASTPMSLTGDAGVPRCRRPVDQCLHKAPCLPQAIRNAQERQDVPAFPSALTAHRTFVRVNFGVISVRARRRPRCGKEDLHALCRDVIRSRRCTGCIVPLRGVRMEGSGLSLGKSRGRSRSGFGSSRVRGLRRGRFHRDSFSPSKLFFPCPVSPCVGRTHFFVCPIA